MERTVRSEGRQEYRTAVTDLWERVASALTRLERIADSTPEVIAHEIGDELPGLQYSLHAGAELAVGIAPPPHGEALHHELVAALGEARDATAEVAAAAELDDPDVLATLLPEWRGTLFRVRLARLRALERAPDPAVPVAAPAEAAAEAESPPRPWTPLVATALILAGAFLFTAGAVLVAWPVWAAGLGLFAGGFVLYRP